MKYFNITALDNVQTLDKIWSNYTYVMTIIQFTQTQCPFRGLRAELACLLIPTVTSVEVSTKSCKTGMGRISTKCLMKGGISLYRLHFRA